MKNAQNFNKSEESLDNTLLNTINDLHRDRNEVREVLHEYQSGASKHLHVPPQIVFMCKQLLALLSKYAWKNMADIPGRNPLSRHLTVRTKLSVAERTFEVKTRGSRKAREEATSNGMTLH